MDIVCRPVNLFSQHRTSIVLLMCLSVLGTVAWGEPSRGYDLPCLAPLLERVDAAAPLNLDEAFLFGPWHAPKKRDGIGVVSFQIATDSAESQRWFNQGVALLHAFWYSEAERCFRQALISDPDCPMLYWGLAMANERRPQRAAVFAEEAKRYSSNRADLSALERGWIEILTEFYAGERATFEKRKPGVGKAVRAGRRRERIRQLEALAFANPDDVEPEAFLLRQVILDESRHGDAIASYHANDLLAAKIAAAAPAHPSKLYRVLLWLERDPQRALPFANEVVLATPAITDAWRIAGEAYRANGRLRRAAELFQGAVRLGLREVNTMPDLTENLVSNYAALVDAQVSMGRFEDALGTAEALIRMPRTFYLEKRHTHEQRLAGSYATGRRLLGQAHLRLERWDELLLACGENGALGPGMEGDWYSRTDSLFWRGIAQANLGQFDAARAVVEDLKNHIRKAKGSGADDAEQRWMVALARSLRTHLEFSSGQRKRLPDEAMDTTWLTPDHLARLYFSAGLKPEAIGLIDAELAQRPGQFLCLANYADLHFRNGDQKQALFHFDRKFRQDAALASSKLAVVKRLQPVADAMRFKGRWTIVAPALEAIPALPSLEKLGPAAWSPLPAPRLVLPDHSGKASALESLRGQPVVMNFFLGVACPFCRVQLDKFAPQLFTYQQMGIKFIGITSDSLETLQVVTGSKSEKSAAGKKLLPFAVFADPDLAAFKSLGAFDHFDAFPMHATILIGADGRLLWSNIGHAPFSHPEALLREAKRLQSLHQTRPSEGK